MSFELLIDEPGYAVAMIDGERCELDWSNVEDADLPGIVADARAIDAADVIAAAERMIAPPFDPSTMHDGPCPPALRDDSETG
ncbi:hypothetical protein [Arthrobacter rhombi]|uniref:hypothetical protein n=1 Tax=Arthrobacter rhombi TaxID=71253 RepID=UPI003FD20A30